MAMFRLRNPIPDLCSCGTCDEQADDLWTDIDRAITGAGKNPYGYWFSDLVDEKAASGCPAAILVVRLAAELLVAAVTPADQEMYHGYLMSVIATAYEGTLPTDDELDDDLAQLINVLRQRDQSADGSAAVRHLPGEPCREEASGGCGCERSDCGGYTCHRRDPSVCTCFRHGDPAATERPATVLTGYADSWPVYKRLGWAGVLPLRTGTKFPPPTGFTGWDGPDPSGADCAEMAELARYRGTTQTGLRMSSTVVGIDVDGYDGRTGGETIAEAQRRWGPLPAGPSSSARDDGVSMIRFFTVPDGTVLVTEISFPELELGHVEIIQRHHRYAVVAPSVHPKLGMPYLWRDATGAVMPSPPAVADLPALADRWLTELAGTGNEGEKACPEEVERFLADLPAGTVCESVRAALRAAERDLGTPSTSDGGRPARRCRHDDTMRHVLGLLRLGEQGHPGVPLALGVLRKLFVETVTADESRTAKAAGAEFDRMREGTRGIGLIKANPTPGQRRGCRYCGQPSDPERTRRALVGAVDKVLSAGADERGKLLRWAAGKVYAAVADGHLSDTAAATLLVGTARDAGLGEVPAQRLIAEHLRRLEAVR